MIKELPLDKFKNIYFNHMIYDFPENELKLFDMIEDIIKKRKGLAIAYYQNNILTGYATLIFVEDKLLLDYFAIIKDFRNMGYGKKFIKELQEYFHDYAFLLIESEDNDSIQAKKRIEFYKRCGCKDSGIKIELYFVDYALLYLELNKQIDINIKEEVLSIYKNVYPNYIGSKYLIFKN